MPADPGGDIRGAGRGRARRASSRVLTARVPDPAGSAASSATPQGAVRAIVEEQDATPAQRAIDEINTGVMAAPTALLRRWVGGAQDRQCAERVLPDRHRRAGGADGVAGRGARRRRRARRAAASTTARSWRRSSASCRRGRADALMQAGTSLADPARIDIRGTLACGRDVRIDVGCVFEGDGRARPTTSTIGPYCVLRERDRRRRHARSRAFSHLDDATIGARLPHRPVRAAAARRHARRRRAHRQFRRGQGEHDRPRLQGQSSRLHRRRDGRRAASTSAPGTITANYDGANKHRTVIGDDASHRIELRAGRAGHDRRGRDDRRRQHDHRRRAGRCS